MVVAAAREVMVVGGGGGVVMTTASCIYEKCYAIGNGDGLEPKTIEMIFRA